MFAQIKDNKCSQANDDPPITSEEVNQWYCATMPETTRVRLFDPFYDPMTRAIREFGLRPLSHTGLALAELRQCALVVNSAKSSREHHPSPDLYELKNAFAVAKERLNYLGDLIIKQQRLIGATILINEIAKLDPAGMPEPVFSQVCHMISKWITDRVVSSSSRALIVENELVGGVAESLDFALHKGHLDDDSRLALALKIHEIAPEIARDIGITSTIEAFAGWMRIGRTLKEDKLFSGIFPESFMQSAFASPLISQITRDFGRERFGVWYANSQDQMWDDYAPFMAMELSKFYPDLSQDQLRSIAGNWHEAYENDALQSVSDNLEALKKLHAIDETYPFKAYAFFNIHSLAYVGTDHIARQIDFFSNAKAGSEFGIELRSYYDWSGSFSDRIEDRLELEKDTSIPCVAIEAQSCVDAFKAITPIISRIGRASYLQIYSHGNRKSFMESDLSCPKEIQALRNISEGLHPEAPIILHSCKGGVKNGPAQLIENIMQRRVIALRSDSAFQRVYAQRTSNGPVIKCSATNTQDKVTVNNGRSYRRFSSSRPIKNGRLELN